MPFGSNDNMTGQTVYIWSEFPDRCRYFVSNIHNPSDLDAGLNAHIDYVIRSGSADNFLIDLNSGLITVAPNAELDIDDLAIPEEEPVTDMKEIFTIVEEMAQFPGGEQAMMKFIKDHGPIGW